MAKNGKPRKKSKKKASERSGSLLSRFFKAKDDGDGKKAKGKSGASDKAKAKPLTPLDRSIQEIKHMAKVGESDPERLAMMLSRLLGQEKEKQRQAKEDFDQMVWDIVKKEEAGNEATDDASEGDDAAEQGGADSPPTPPGPQSLN